MKSSNYVFLSLVALLSASSAWATPKCRIPSGNVFRYVTEEERNHPRYPNAAAADDNSITHTVIEPSADCKSVRIWQYFGSAVTPPSSPTPERCAAATGDFTPDRYTACHVFKIVKTEEELKGTSEPVAHLDKDGKLRTKHVAGSGLGYVRGFYWSTKGETFGFEKFELASSPSASQYDSRKDSSKAVPDAGAAQESGKGSTTQQAKD